MMLLLRMCVFVCFLCAFELKFLLICQLHKRISNQSLHLLLFFYSVLFLSCFLFSSPACAPLLSLRESGRAVLPFDWQL